MEKRIRLVFLLLAALALLGGGIMLLAWTRGRAPRTSPTTPLLPTLHDSETSAGESNAAETSPVVSATAPAPPASSAASTPTARTAANTPPKFTLVWRDDFDAPHPRWAFGNWTFEENQCEFRVANAALAAGRRALSVATKTDDDQGNYPTKPCWGGEAYTPDGWQYGRFTVAMQPKSPAGVVSSFFLFHQEFDEQGNLADWAEIDIEFPGRTTQVQYNVRWMTAGQTGVSDDEHLVNLGFDANQTIHDYAIEWTPDRIVFLVDGQPSFAYTDPKILAEIAQPLSVRMNSWVTSAAAWAGDFNPASLPAQTEYDSVTYERLD